MCLNSRQPSIADMPLSRPGADPVEDLRAGWNLGKCFGLDSAARPSMASMTAASLPGARAR